MEFFSLGALLVVVGVLVMIGMIANVGGTERDDDSSVEGRLLTFLAAVPAVSV